MALIRDLRGAPVLVLGGAGFVGSQLVRELLALECQVAVYDNYLHGSPTHIEGLEVEAIYGDVLDEWKLLDAFQTVKPRFVFNLVGDTYVPTAYDLPKRFFRINVEGCLNVLMACRHAPVERLLHVSSTEVYGRAQRVPMCEDHPLDPANTYAVSKLAADRLCATFHAEHGTPVLVARIFNCFGPRETEPYVIAEIVTQLDKGPRVELGNLAAARDFTYVADTARGLIAALRSDLPDGQAVNVGTGVAVEIRELVHRVADIYGYADVEIVVDPRRLRRQDVELFLCDATRLREATGWRPDVPLDEGLRRTVAWFREHGRRWVWEDRVEGVVTPRSAS